jgi:hypothetical protein
LESHRDAGVAAGDFKGGDGRKCFLQLVEPRANHSI